MEIKIGIGILLAVNAWQDIKKREIVPLLLLIYFLAGIAGNLLLHFRSWPDMLGGAAVGLAVVLLAWLNSGVGQGDGWTLCVTGIYLGFRENACLLLLGMAACAATAAVLLLLRKVNRKTELPFIPFLLAAYIGGSIW